MPRKCAMKTALTVETDCPSFRFPRTEKGNVLACPCMNGPRLPEAAPGKESCAGARVKSHMAYSSCVLDIL